MPSFRLLAVLVAAMWSTAPVVAAKPAAPSFDRDVMAVLSRAGCNAGACHGNLNGKGGFKLSLRGEDPAADWATLTRDMLARRIDTLRPDQSLVLLKASGGVSHEGGVRFSDRAPENAILRDWVASGAPADPPGQPALTRLTVSPANKVLVDPEDRFRVAVTAHFANGTTRDVTSLAAFDFTVPGVARITPQGEVIREESGEVVLLVRYLGRLAPVRAVFLPNRPEPDMRGAIATT